MPEQPHWNPGDQAMCIKPFGKPKAIGPDTTALPDDQKPCPPMIYDVVMVYGPDCFPGHVIDDPAPAYLLFSNAGKHPTEENARAAFDCRHFRKVPPLSPEQIDLPESVPAPEPA
ncbi:MAG: hypothetical protein Tp170SUR191951_22 [Prokaryotic dsDNA virus sp.]|nr:hypothetical protein [Pseudomonas sp.]MBS67324.1 hypothetical protein [Pseudomonas sp.]QDP55184.1 MAG: hypothetical protein Tp170SUR191951_22 [Prokaryotic dsDNA virus sp.]|tara:strand:+ start:214 stop:558 length:345 start_codon:yes stop_codon:yes gene_type:complete